MPPPEIKVDHDELDKVAAILSRCAAEVDRTLSEIKQRVDVLRGGGWVGLGATQFYREMDDLVAPVLERLARALEAAGNAILQISRIFEEAEEEAARVRAGGGGTPGGGGAAPGDRLLGELRAKLPDVAALIGRSPAARRLVAEAEAAGVEFGGFAEDGPAPTLGRAYTVGNKVYVPRSSTDNITASSDFLFELNNGIRRPQFEALHTEAAKGSAGTLTAQTYAYKKAELEVEGMLRSGEVWSEMKTSLGGRAALNRYDSDFFLSDYQAVRDGTKTKDALVRDVLSRRYDTGTLAGKTVQQFYEEQYREVSGGR